MKDNTHIYMKDLSIFLHEVLGHEVWEPIVCVAGIKHGDRWSFAMYYIQYICVVNSELQWIFFESPIPITQRYIVIKCGENLQMQTMRSKINHHIKVPTKLTKIPGHLDGTKEICVISNDHHPQT
jgi:hypothetical protein